MDAIGERAEKLSEQLNLLQKMIKYGVPSRFQILICENIFDDRIIAKQLEEIIGSTPIIITEKEFKDFISTKRRNILRILKSHPAYFRYRFRMYVK